MEVPELKPWNTTPWWIAAIIGALLWVGIAAGSGQQEAWDDPSYWRLGYPAMVLLSALLGWFFPRRAWQHGLAMMLAQLMPLLIVHPFGPLLPLGILFLGGLAVPAMAAAWLAALLHRRPG